LQNKDSIDELLCSHVVLLQVAEHKRAVDRMLEEKRERYEEARRAEEAEAAARCAQALRDVAVLPCSRHVTAVLYCYDKRCCTQRGSLPVRLNWLCSPDQLLCVSLPETYKFAH
jgi:hypothetical protein